MKWLLDKCAEIGQWVWNNPLSFIAIAIGLVVGYFVLIGIINLIKTLKK